MSYHLGFLLCDHPLEHLALRFADYPDMFARAFAAVSNDITWHVYDVTQGQLPASDAACDGYLISGSRHGAYDELPWIAPLERFIRALAGTARPLVGLCFGHQIIGQALGGRVAKAEQGWGIGVHRYTTVAHEDWMQPRRSDFAVPVCHQDQVVQLPAGARRVAGNQHCENFVVRYAGNILGIQGHPEFEAAFIEALIAWREDSLPGATHAAALASLDTPHDNLIIKRWIARFLRIPEKPLNVETA